MSDFKGMVIVEYPSGEEKNLELYVFEELVIRKSQQELTVINLEEKVGGKLKPEDPRVELILLDRKEENLDDLSLERCLLEKGCKIYFRPKGDGVSIEHPKEFIHEYKG
jgi:hypothetical protein